MEKLTRQTRFPKWKYWCKYGHWYPPVETSFKVREKPLLLLPTHLKRGSALVVRDAIANYTQGKSDTMQRIAFAQRHASADFYRVLRFT